MRAFNQNVTEISNCAFRVEQRRLHKRSKPSTHMKEKEEGKGWGEGGIEA